MKIKNVLFLILLSYGICSSSFCQSGKEIGNQESGAVMALTEYYESLMKFDFVGVRINCAADFKLVEGSGIYALEEYIGFLEPDAGKLEIEYSLDELNSTTDGAVSWVTYRKKTKIVTGDKEIFLEARESALLTKEKDNWKLRLVHSTNIE
jgi:hypothetical protein